MRHVCSSHYGLHPDALNAWTLNLNKILEVANRLVETWGECTCIINTRDIMKEIPRNDNVIQALFKPFLEKINESW